MLLTWDRWQGTRDTGGAVDAPCWHDIESAIRRLDGEVYTMVTISAGEGIYLSIGGGSGQFVVTGSTDNNQTFFTLVDRAQGDVMQQLVAGGQEGDYPARMCVGLETALRAAKRFAMAGERESSLSWELT